MLKGFMAMIFDSCLTVGKSYFINKQNMILKKRKARGCRTDHRHQNGILR